METLLDLECAKLGHKIVEAIESNEGAKIKGMVTKLLGVLQEDGLYAFALYAKAKAGPKDVEKRTAKAVFDSILLWLKQDNIALLPKPCEDLLEGIRTKLAEDLDKLLLTKELLERVLVYARYHAEALGDAK